MSESKTMTRKEVADFMEVSIDFVKRHEESLGLRAVRIQFIGTRTVRYRRDAVISILASRGYESHRVAPSNTE